MLDKPYCRGRTPYKLLGLCMLPMMYSVQAPRPSHSTIPDYILAVSVLSSSVFSSGFVS